MILLLLLHCKSRRIQLQAVENIKVMISETTKWTDVVLLNRIYIPLLGQLISLSVPPSNVKAGTSHYQSFHTYMHLSCIHNAFDYSFISASSIVMSTLRFRPFRYHHHHPSIMGRTTINNFLMMILHSTWKRLYIFRLLYIQIYDGPVLEYI